jgi:hypothetical protein
MFVFHPYLVRFKVEAWRLDQEPHLEAVEALP